MRKTLLLAAAAAGLTTIVAFASPLGTPAAPHWALQPLPGGTVVFDLTGNARIVHVHGRLVSGKAPFKSTANLAKISGCIAGNDISCAGKIEVDEGGKAYLLFDSPTQMRIATNSGGTGATVLTGLTDGTGNFQMSGNHTLSDTTFFVTGKMTFSKETLVPKKISGKILAYSPTDEHYGTGNFTAKPAIP